VNRRRLLVKQEIKFEEWLEFLFFNRLIFTKIAVSLVLLLLIPSNLALIFAGSVAGIVFTALACCLAIVFVGVLRYRYWLDIANHPRYWSEMLNYVKKKREKHADVE